MAAVYTINLVINAGSDFNETFFLENVDLSACTLSAQLRKWNGSSNYTQFESQIINPSQGTIRLSLSQQQTKILKPGRYVYDAIITTPFNFTSKIIEGMALVREGAVLSV
jgi:hypothetical protein